MSVTKGPTQQPAYQHQPQQQPFQMGPQIGTPPAMPQQPSGVTRVVGFVRGLTGQAFGLAVVVFAFQGFMPEGRRPSDLIGSFHGSTRTAELDAERVAQVRTAASMAIAQAAAPANYQMETQLSQTQQQLMAGSLEAQSSMANMADVACIGGGVLGAFFGSNPDAAEIAKGLLSTCGASDAIRKNMNNTLSRTARDGSGVIQRSAPQALTAGAEQYTPYAPGGRPVPAAAPQR